MVRVAERGVVRDVAQRRSADAEHDERVELLTRLLGVRENPGYVLRGEIEERQAAFVVTRIDLRLSLRQARHQSARRVGVDAVLPDGLREDVGDIYADA